MVGNPKDSRWYATPTENRTRKPIRLTIDDETRVKLKKLAKKLNISMSQVVDRLVRDYPL